MNIHLHESLIIATLACLKDKPVIASVLKCHILHFECVCLLVIGDKFGSITEVVIILPRSIKFTEMVQIVSGLLATVDGDISQVYHLFCLIVFWT